MSGARRTGQAFNEAFVAYSSVAAWCQATEIEPLRSASIKRFQALIRTNNERLV